MRNVGKKEEGVTLARKGEEGKGHAFLSFGPNDREKRRVPEKKRRKTGTIWKRGRGTCTSSSFGGEKIGASC